MRRWSVLFAGIIFLVSAARGDDGLPPDTVTAVKHATVFIRVDGPDAKGTGSGFVIAATKDTVLVVTSYRVVGPPDFDKKPRVAPAEFAKSLKAAAVTVVFDGGTKAELSAKAEVIAGDPVNDLAVLHVTGLKAPAKPIDYASPSKPSETMTVYSFGHPAGDAVAVGKGAPAVAVSKAAVSSLRLDDNGELAKVKLDGTLNPGHSGGPALDTKGKLVGVVVSGLPNGGMGYAVPAQEVGRIMKGRLDGFRMNGSIGADGKVALKADVGVLDPTGAIRGATLHYVVVPPNGTIPKPGEPIAKLPGAKSVPLKIAGGVATGELTVEKAAGGLFVQAVPDGVAGALGASRVESYSLAKTPTGATAPVIAGGRTDAVFSDPLPAGAKLVGLEVGVGKLGPNSVVKGARAIFRVDNKEVPGTWHGADGVTEKVRVVAKAGYAVGGLSVRTGAGVFGLSVTFMKEVNGQLDPKDSYESDWVGAAVGLGPFKVGGTGEPACGFAGKKNADAVSGVGLLYADTGKKEPDKVALAPASDKMPPGVPDAGGAAAAPAPVRPGERGPRIQGGVFDTELRDHAPAGGVLVGFHVGLGKFINNDIVKAIRPIYRVGDKDANGNPFGTSPTGLAKLVAKPGYAVGGVTLKTGLGIDGLSVTFMKLADGKLDPTDAYESEWVGGKGGGGEVKIGGDGTLVVGALLKLNAQNANSVSVTGLGLVYSDTNTPALDGPWPAGVSTKIQGGGGDPEFREAGPDGALLVGLEIGVGRFFDKPVVSNVRAIFRAAGMDSEGEWHGTPKEDVVKEVVKLVARPGYAVGAITVKTGLGIDGLSVTFAKVVDGKLNPRDTYESEWVGGQGGGGPVKISGEGALVIGLTGKARSDGTSGLGLLLPLPKKK